MQLNQYIHIYRGREGEWFWLSEISLCQLYLKTGDLSYTKRANGKLICSEMYQQFCLLLNYQFAFCIDCFVYLVFILWSLCLLYATDKRANLPYFLSVAGLALHIATRRRNPFFFLVVKNISKNHIGDTEGKENLCPLFSCSLVMFYQWWVSRPCLFHQSTPWQSPCSRIARCFPTTTEKNSVFRAAPGTRGSGESQKHANVSFIYLWVKPLSAESPGNVGAPAAFHPNPTCTLLNKGKQRWWWWQWWQLD